MIHHSSTWLNPNHFPGALKAANPGVEEFINVLNPKIEDIANQIRSRAPNSQLTYLADERLTSQPNRYESIVDFGDESSAKIQKQPKKHKAKKNQNLNEKYKATIVKYKASMTQKQPLILKERVQVVDASKVPSTNPFDNIVDTKANKVSTNPFDTEVKTLVVNEEISVSEETSDTNPFSQANQGTNSVAGGREEERKMIDEMVFAANRVNLSSDGSDELIPTAPREGLFQNVTLGKVVKVAGFALLVTVGGVTAYHFLPVVAGIQGATALAAGRSVAANIGTAAVTIHGSMIQPGFAGTLLMANLITDFAVIPAAKMALPVLLPVISTAVVTTLTTIALLYVANKMWIVASAAIWNTGSAVANKIGEELDQTLPGQIVKFAAVKAVAPYTNVVKALMAPKESEVSEDESALLLLTDSEESSAEEIDGSNSIGNGNSTEEVKKAKRAKTQKKTQQTAGNAILWAGLYTVGLGAAGYLVVNWMKRDS